MATLTYVYAEQTAVLGPMATFAEPHTYDLCVFHAERLTAPQGWDLVRLASHFEEAPERDDLTAVAEAVRETPPLPGLDTLDGLDGPEYLSRSHEGGDAPPAHGNGTDGLPGHRPAHLRVLRDR